MNYTGREDDRTGFYYYRARYYSPKLQRFVSEDPLGLRGGDVNLYAYVGNNVVNARDPLGLRIDWGDNVFTNPYVVANMNKMNQALVNAGFPDDTFLIRITGGDRYIDSQGNHRSVTDDSIVGDSDQTSPHLLIRGARGVDFNITGVSDEAMLATLWFFTSFTQDYSSSGTYYDRRPGKEHWHTHLPNIPPFNNPWAGMQPVSLDQPTDGRKDEGGYGGYM